MKMTLRDRKTIPDSFISLLNVKYLQPARGSISWGIVLLSFRSAATILLYTYRVFILQAY
jgi:hypothetical protein